MSENQEYWFAKVDIDVIKDKSLSQTARWIFTVLSLNIKDHDGLQELVKKYHAEGKLIAAICAAPAALGRAGVLAGKTAVCYPGLESHLTGAKIGSHIVETDGNITTAKGPAVTPFFALKLLEILEGKAMADEVAEGFLIPLVYR